jgi:hypothetical protein
MRDRCLGRVVCSQIALRAHPAHRRHVDDRTARAFHQRNDKLAAEEDADHIDFEFMAELVERQFLDRAVRRNPGIVDQYVDAIERLKGARPACFVRHVQVDKASSIPEFTNQRLTPFDIDIGNDHTRAFCHIAPRDCLSQSGRTARHQRDLALQSHLSIPCDQIVTSVLPVVLPDISSINASGSFSKPWRTLASGFRRPSATQRSRSLCACSSTSG